MILLVPRCYLSRTWVFNKRRRNIQHNDIQHIDIHYNGLTCDTQHKELSVIMLSVAFSHCDAECDYAECRGSQQTPFWLPLQNVNPKFSSKSF
jgi:hypothetical protein